MPERILTVEGRVVDAGSQAGLAGLRVELWDKALRCDEMLGSALTKDDGSFKAFLDPQHLEELFKTQLPELFFRVYEKGEMLASTEDSVTWRGPDQGSVTITVEPLRTRGPERPMRIQNVFLKRNEATRIDCFEAIDENNRTGLLTFFRRLGAPHFFWERVEPLMAQGNARIVAAVRDRPWPPGAFPHTGSTPLSLHTPSGTEAMV